MNAISRAHVEKIAQIDALTKSPLCARSRTRSPPLEIDHRQHRRSRVPTRKIMRATMLRRHHRGAWHPAGAHDERTGGPARRFADRTTPRFEQRARSLSEEIAVIEEALENRREQIRLLAQTGALSDAPSQNDEASLAEMISLRDRIVAQLEAARDEARELNRRRIDLNRIEQEIAAADELLDETRRALEVIRLESGRALPGTRCLNVAPLAAGRSRPMTAARCWRLARCGRRGACPPDRPDPWHDRAPLALCRDADAGGASSAGAAGLARRGCRCRMQPTACATF